MHKGEDEIKKEKKVNQEKAYEKNEKLPSLVQLIQYFLLHGIFQNHIE